MAGASGDRGGAGRAEAAAPPPRREAERRPRRPRAVPTVRLEEFERLRRRLSWALAAMLALVLVGVVAYGFVARNAHGVIDAIYMTVITLTTVGYGEAVDLSNDPAGRVFTVLFLLVGMGIFAYAIPMLAAFVIEGHLLHIFARRRMEKTIASLSGHHVVCGDSGVTWFVVEELVRTHRKVVLVAPGEEALEEARSRFPDVPVVQGDPSDDEVLLAAGIARARGVVASMEEDKDNVLVVFTARRLAPQARIIAGVENPAQDSKLRQAGADAVVSASRIGGLRMASEMVRPAVVSFLDKMLRDASSGLRVEEIVVPPGSHCVGRTIGALHAHDVSGAVLLALRRPGAESFQFDPPADQHLEAGTTLIVMVDADGRERLEAHVAG